MTIFQEFLVLLTIICGLAACTSTAIERTSDATTVPASVTNTYSEPNLASSSSVYFSYDNYNIDSIGSEKIKTLASLVKKNGANVRVEGHCDERGTREYNLALGERRANAVKDYLMTYGISGSRLSVISYGKERPVNSGSNPLAWSQNRRSVTVKAN